MKLGGPKPWQVFPRKHAAVKLVKRGFGELAQAVAANPQAVRFWKRACVQSATWSCTKTEDLPDASSNFDGPGAEQLNAELGEHTVHVPFDVC